MKAAGIPVSRSFGRWAERTARTYRFRPVPPATLLTASDIQAACERLTARVETAHDVRELRDVATELRFLTLHAERVAEARLADRANPRELGAVRRSLCNVRQDLSALSPLLPYRYGEPRCFIRTRNGLYQAIWRLRYGLLLLAWAHGKVEA